MVAVSVSSDWAAHARAVIDQAGGHRRGAARNAMIDLLAEQACAVTAVEIEDELRRRERPVARASVYRILELLGERRLINRLDLGDGSSRFEAIHPGGEHHHHLLCDSCGRLFPFDDEGLESSIERVSQRLGFRARDHEVVLHGACEGCAE